LHSVDPANVPASRVTGAPRVISSTTDLLVATVPTDGGTLTVTCARFGRIWRVTLHDFRRTGA
jgi:hypothetical protein